MQGDECVTTKPRKAPPATVPFGATPAGEPPSLRDWANPTVWTDRMLTTLEQGVRGGRWHTLIDKVFSPNNLFVASGNVIGNRGAAGVDHQTAEDFLGYHFRGTLRLPRKKSLAKLKDPVRGETKRTSGHCLPSTCARLSPRLRGWFAYFRHCHGTVFRDLDAWIRGRLRSILRKRARRRGRARGKDHQRWPNAYFDEFGLYCLSTAHPRFGQPFTR